MAQGFRRSNNQRSRAAKSIRPNALSVSAKAEYPLSQPQRELAFRAKVPFHNPFKRGRQFAACRHWRISKKLSLSV
jgi:hypothetical protein